MDNKIEILNYVQNVELLHITLTLLKLLQIKPLELVCCFHIRIIHLSGEDEFQC